MKWLRSRALLSGVALILGTDIVVLGGVAYNRSGEPESTLKLTERELTVPYAYGLTTENSGVELHIAWRVVEEKTTDLVMSNYYGYGASPYWLDEAKLASLGIDTSRLHRTGEDKPGGRTLPSREVFLVLELDGAEYRKLLEQKRSFAASAENLLRAAPENKDAQRRAKSTADALIQEERKNSRLVVVDAGLDTAVLRTAYPDRTRYLIARGRIVPEVSGEAAAAPRGRILGLSVAEVNVPASFRNVLGDSKTSFIRDGKTLPPFEFTISYGKRLEPWIAGTATSAVN